MIDPLPAPFIPALELHQAAKVRLGNQALSMFSYAIPSRIPADLMAGSLQNINTSTGVEGYTFSVVFSGVTYRASLERVHLEATSDNDLSFKLGFRQIDLTLGRTSVRGQRHSASTGPIQMTLGTQSPLWLDIRVEPYIEDGRIHLREKGSQFYLDRNTMRVSPPSGVSVDGLGMTRDRVSEGLVRGLYDSRTRIEQEIKKLSPLIVAQLEKNLDLNQIIKESSSIWPLPVYAPRLQLQPNSVSVDANGFSLGLDFIVAAYDETQAPENPRIVVNPDPLTVGTGTELEVALATNTMTEAMQLLIDEGLSGIDVEDIPGTAFDQWSDPNLWQTLLAPSGKTLPSGPKRVRLTLQQPLYVGSQVSVQNDLDKPTAEQISLGAAEVLSISRSRLTMPDVRLTLLTGSVVEERTVWEPWCMLDFDLTQLFDLSFVKPAHTLRELQVSFPERMQVQVESRSSQEGEVLPIDKEVASEEFMTSLQSWLEKATRQTMVVPDLDMKSAGLRANKLQLNKGKLSVVYSTPVVRIVNTTDAPQRYRTRGPYTNWSQEWVLGAGETHQYTLPYPMLYQRQVNGVNELYTLPLGADVEFRWVEGDGSDDRIARLFMKPQRPEKVEPVRAEQITRSPAELGLAQ
ncbi:MAG: hypothetical protein R3C11_25180 [Planctomycetaceae bacterium]